MTKEEIRALLNDIESDRVERTVSTTNTDKFGQAICAFANDLPDYQLPGYLFLGVKDDGEVLGQGGFGNCLTHCPFYTILAYMPAPMRQGMRPMSMPQRDCTKW